MLRKVSPSDVTDALQLCELNRADVLHEADVPIRHVYFPVNAMVSLVVPLCEGRQVEVAVVGNEGVIGLPSVVEDRRVHMRAIVQIPGDGYRLDADLFCEAVEAHPELTAMVRRYTLAHLQAVAQSVACNRLHNVQQRICRWLLTCHDRVEGNQFPLTQKYIAQMLSVQRPTVSEAAARLQYQRLITYKRGLITILDRQRLEQAACECYGVIRREYDRLVKSDI